MNRVDGPVGPAELAHFQGAVFRRKLDWSLSAVTAALSQCKRPYVAFSGGKDSLVTLALVHAIAPEVPLVWSDDELEYPETVAYMARMRTVAPWQLTVTLGWARHANWFDPWRDEPFWREPFEGAIWLHEDVDDWHASMGHDCTFLGTRAGENRRRRDWLAQSGPVYRVNRGTGLRCCPVADWTEDDVWALIAGWGLPYNAAYDTYCAIGVPRKAQRIGPLPLARRAHLAEGWPDTLERLEGRYGRRWE